MKDKEMIEEMAKLSFSVIDNKTSKYPDLYKIALKEDWAKGLMYCDMEGFSINEDGQLILSDECGKFVYCPSDRFTVVFEDSVVLSREEYEKLTAPRLFIKPRELNQKELAEKLKDFNYGIIGVDDSSIEIIPTRAEIEKEMSEKTYKEIRDFFNGLGRNQVLQKETIVSLIEKLAHEKGFEIKE